MIGIYKIISPTNRVYIGQSNNINVRFNSYKTTFKKGTLKQPLLKRSFSKYGIENHRFEIIEECLLEELNERERFWQEHYDVLNGGLNACLVSTLEKKFVHSEESKSKISKIHKGKKLSIEQIEKHRQLMKGKTISEEHKKKLLEGRRRVSFSEKGRLSIGLANKNRIISDETKLKMSLKKKGVRFNEDHKQKISESLKGKKRPKEVVEKYSMNRRKIILDSNTGIFYFGAKEIAEALNISVGLANHRLNKGRFNHV